MGEVAKESGMSKYPAGLFPPVRELALEDGATVAQVSKYPAGLFPPVSP